MRRIMNRFAALIIATAVVLSGNSVSLAKADNTDFYDGQNCMVVRDEDRVKLSEEKGTNSDADGTKQDEASDKKDISGQDKVTTETGDEDKKDKSSTEKRDEAGKNKTATNKDETKDTHDIYYDYNELYHNEDGIKDAAEQVASSLNFDDNSEVVNAKLFASIREAGEYYRKCLVARQEMISFAVNYDGSRDASDVYFDIRTIAFEETDKTYEGDYLYWNWTGVHYEPKIKDGIVEFDIQAFYRSTQEEELDIDAEVKKLLDIEFSGWKNKSTYENVKDIYDWITYNIEYVTGSDNHSTYSAIIEHRTVCQGFATTFYRLAREMGISTRVIASSIHGWNIVKIGDRYYDLDTTWDAQKRSGEWDYFLKCEENFYPNGDHLRLARYKTTQFNKQYPMATKDYPVKKADIGFDIICSPHIQSYGWLDGVGCGNVIGTTGESKRLEAIVLSLRKNTRYDLDIEVMGHIQSIGWTDDYISSNGICGTTGKSKRLEAIRLRLVGEDADRYDLFYQVHIQSYGWLGFAKNGESAGSEGLAKRIEALKIVVLPKGKVPKGTIGYSFIQNGKNSYNYNTDDGMLYYKTHVQSYGWQNYVYDGSISGTSGEAKRLEGIEIGINADDASTGIRYKTHIQTYGWEDEWKQNGEMSGTSGQSKRLEAIKIELFGTMAMDYDVYYRVHAQTYGWLGWAKNGEAAGTEGLSKRLEAIQIVVLPKGQTPTEGFGKIAFIK